MMVAQPALVETTGKLFIAVILSNKTIYIYIVIQLTNDNSVCRAALGFAWVC